jgi:hypothetical protein
MRKLPQCARLAQIGIVLAGLFFSSAHAEPDDLFTLIDAKPISEVWLNPGFLSYHWDRDKDLNGDNYGLGAEYRFSTVASVTAGEFYNSDRAHSEYLGLYYQPIGIGPVRFGAAFGGFNGYPHEKNGGWFLAAIPAASYDYKNVGLTVSFVPTYADRLYGSLSFQFNLKVY